MAAYYSDYYKRPTCVYRLYDADDRLLYVGLALNPQPRISTHRRKAWGPLISSYLVEWFPDRETAKAAERSAIFHENPAHNIVRPRIVEVA